MKNKIFRKIGIFTLLIVLSSCNLPFGEKESTSSSNKNTSTIKQRYNIF